MISGNMVGSYSQIGKTFIIQDNDGNEITGVVVDKETVFDATPADVKIGKTFASSDGVLEGENTITYRTYTASRLILSGETFTIPLSEYDQYDYTKFQGTIVIFDSSYDTNVSTMGITIGDCVFSVETSEKLSDITKNSSTKSIDFNITNDSDNIYEIFYFTYHEETEC